MKIIIVYVLLGLISAMSPQIRFQSDNGTQKQWKCGEMKKSTEAANLVERTGKAERKHGSLR